MPTDGRDKTPADMKTKEKHMKITSQNLTLKDGREVTLYALANDNGTTATVATYGGTLVSLTTPDRDGHISDVVCGYRLEDFDYYTEADGYLGALVGRVANRINKGTFTLDGVTYDQLYINDGDNHLHGGKVSFSYKIWTVESITEEADSVALTLAYTSVDGEEGYPGTLTVKVTYALNNNGALSLHYVATTDKATPINLTNHAYFNLGGYDKGDILDHELWLDAESYLAGDEALIPTGEILPVDSTPFDFREAKPIGEDFYADHKDLKLAGGYDHCFNFKGWQNCRSGGEVVVRGYVHDPKSGRDMTMLTNQPCVQFYSANFLKNPAYPLRGSEIGDSNIYPQKTQHALCLETQMMPDSMNHENFTDCILRPGQVYDYTTVYVFSTDAVEE